MKLKQYLKQEQMTPFAFAKKHGLRDQSVYRYINGERIPDEATMEIIYRATKGQVTPNDFHGLPSLKPRLPASAVAE
jgi:DNA-binding transcriptional regulator YdaS (Cro superfamily)